MEKSRSLYFACGYSACWRLDLDTYIARVERLEMDIRRTLNKRKEHQDLLGTLRYGMQ